MSVSSGNRVQSAYPRSSYRSGSAVATKSDIPARPMTSLGTHPLNQAALKTLEAASYSSTNQSRRRPKTASSITSVTTAQSPPPRKLRSEEIDRLLDTLNRDSTFFVQVDCLADYRKLVETIDLRQTPINFQYLRDLQRQENLIIQKNACRDKRFRSLIDALEPIRDDEVHQVDDEHERHHTVISGYTTTESYY